MIARVMIVENGSFPMADISTKDGKISFRTPLTGPMAGRLRRREKAFFQMTIEDGIVEIGDEAKESEGW